MEDSERDSFKKVKLVDYPMHLNILRGDYISVIVMQERKGKVIIAYYMAHLSMAFILPNNALSEYCSNQTCEVIILGGCQGTQNGHVGVERARIKGVGGERKVLNAKINQEVAI